MKTFIRLFIVVGVALVFYSNLYAGTFKAESYKEVEAKVLKLKVEDFRNAKVFYTGTFTNILTTFPRYVNKSGIKAGKYFWLVITPNNVPVVTRKRKGLDDKIIAIKKGSTVKVYGKIKKLKYKGRASILTPYYLDLDSIEVVSEPEKELPEEDIKKRNQKKWNAGRKKRLLLPKPPK